MKKDEPAFPCLEKTSVIIESVKPNGTVTKSHGFMTMGGCTKFELAAMFAMVGLVVCRREYDPEGVAKSSVRFAEALMEELEKREMLSAQ